LSLPGWLTGGVGVGGAGRVIGGSFESGGGGGGGVGRGVDGCGADGPGFMMLSGQSRLVEVHF